MLNPPTPRQLKQAQELGIDARGKGRAELRRAIKKAGATPQQRALLAQVRKILQMKEPISDDLTFGEAWDELEELMPQANAKVLNDQGWSQGDILNWKGRYFEIDSIYKRSVLNLVMVRLESRNGRVRVVRSTIRSKHYPLRFLNEGAVLVDLSTHK